MTKKMQEQMQHTMTMPCRTSHVLEGDVVGMCWNDKFWNVHQDDFGNEFWNQLRDPSDNFKALVTVLLKEASGE